MYWDTTIPPADPDVSTRAEHVALVLRSPTARVRSDRSGYEITLHFNGMVLKITSAS